MVHLAMSPRWLTRPLLWAKRAVSASVCSCTDRIEGYLVKSGPSKEDLYVSSEGPLYVTLRGCPPLRRRVIDAT